MEDKALFGGTVSILEKVLDFRSQRHNVILSNIVNADTPGFKSFDIVMDEEADRIHARAIDGMQMASTTRTIFPRVSRIPVVSGLALSSTRN